MRIGVDLDGVMADFDKGWVDRYNRDFNANVEYKHCDHWHSLLTNTHFKDYDTWWDWARSKHSDLFLELEPLPGAVRGVQMLSMDHDIVIITSKPRWAAGHPGEWLMKYDIPFDELHITNSKQHVCCDVYVDDANHNIRDVLNYTDAMAIHYHAWPYVNRGDPFPIDDAAYFASNNRYYRASSWADVLHIVRST